jgi:ATP-dependent DNA helicase DinG
VRRVQVRAHDVLGPGSPLSRTLDGYEERPAQMAMAEAVEAALENGRALFVEAGTGTGKTLAYLVPAILSGKKVVISTATKALQEQIFTKDLPLVAEVLAAHGITFKAALMKGLSNYLCKRRFQELRTSAESGASGAGGLALARLERWALTTETGDRAELTDLAEDAPIWREAQSSTETRIGAGCPHFEACFVTRMRREAEDATVVVVNHHLFLADLALRTGRSGDFASAIPNYDAVVFDEAHQLEDIATDFFGVRASTARVDALVRDAEKTLGAAGKLHLLDKGGARSVLDLVTESSRAFFATFVAPRAAGTRGGDTRRVLGASDWSDAAVSAYGELDARLLAMAAHAEEQQDKAGPSDNEAIALIGRRVQDLRRDLHDVVQGSRRAIAAASEGRADSDGVIDGEARVAWIDVRDRSVSIGASPIDLGPTLRARLFDRVPSVICTSATLATSGSFHFAKARLGAPPDVDELVVPSPFDFASRAALYLPRDLPEPADPGFDAAATARIAALVSLTGGGAFVLCTSNRAMRALSAALTGKIPFPVFVQGEAPKHLLLSKFRASGRAVLVATMSFWEGVDVPGRALRLVVLDKIPFAVPSDPIVMARCEQIDRNGGNAFSQYSVPSAAITLKQGFGRLIRTQKDAGIVAILDKRVVTRGYGRALLASLPPARRIGDLEAVRAFAAELGISEQAPAQLSL